jgi:hypothetical protein
VAGNDEELHVVEEVDHLDLGAAHVDDKDPWSGRCRE